jgi:hypothetical protein
LDASCLLKHELGFHFLLGKQKNHTKTNKKENQEKYLPTHATVLSLMFLHSQLVSFLNGVLTRTAVITCHDSLLDA